MAYRLKLGEEPCLPYINFKPNLSISIKPSIAEEFKENCETKNISVQKQAWKLCLRLMNAEKRGDFSKKIVNEIIKFNKEMKGGKKK